LRLAGGGTVATGWRQLLADVLGVPLYAVDVPAASGRGAALLGAIAAGLLGFDDCAGVLAPPAALAAEPDQGRVALYAERYVRFQGVVSALHSRSQEGSS
jgi:xylulokinase